MHRNAPIHSPRRIALTLALALTTLLGATALWAQDEIDQGDEVITDSAPTVSFVVRDAPITRYLDFVERDLGVQLVPRGVAAEEILTEFTVRDATLEDLLAKINSELGWQWYQDDSMPPTTYELYTDEDFRAMVLPRLVIEKSFFLENITAEVAEEFVAEMLSEVGTIVTIPRTNEIIVTDLPQYVEAVERLIAQVDVRLYIRVFRISHAEIQDVADAIERLLSPDGTMEVNERLHTIIVEDLFQNIRRMDLMVELLDVDTILETYHLNYLSEEDISDLLSALDQIVTPEALLEVDYRNSIIILDDTPEVHERAERIIAAFDEPTRQILLQADVVQVRTTTTRDFEMDIAVADDLLLGAGANLGLGVPAITNPAEIFPVFTFGDGGVRFEHMSSHFRAFLSASLSDSTTQLLLSPRIQVKDKEPAVIDVGGEVPFITTTINDNSDTRTFTQQAVREGLLLEVTPFITNTGYVELQIRIENNDATIQQRTVDDASFDVVDRRTQQVETTLIVPDGATRVIAGLLSSGSNDSQAGTPFLSEIPYIGWIFGSHSQEEIRDNLMIFLTPTIVVEAASDFEWRPLLDERPVSGRFATTMPDDVEPLFPPDADGLIPLGNRFLDDGELLGEEDLWLDTPILDMTGPMTPMFPASGEIMGEMGSPEQRFDTLPLVDTELRLEPDGTEAERSGVRSQGPRMSYSGDTAPVLSGTLPSSGSGRSESSRSEQTEESAREEGEQGGVSRRTRAERETTP